jgi:hypothetical protein
MTLQIKRLIISFKDDVVGTLYYKSIHLFWIQNAIHGHLTQKKKVEKLIALFIFNVLF